MSLISCSIVLYVMSWKRGLAAWWPQFLLISLEWMLMKEILVTKFGKLGKRCQHVSFLWQMAAHLVSLDFWTIRALVCSEKQSSQQQKQLIHNPGSSPAQMAAMHRVSTCHKTERRRRLTLCMMGCFPVFTGSGPTRCWCSMFGKSVLSDFWPMRGQFALLNCCLVNTNEPRDKCNTKPAAQRD